MYWMQWFEGEYQRSDRKTSLQFLKEDLPRLSTYFLDANAGQGDGVPLIQPRRIYPIVTASTASRY